MGVSNVHNVEIRGNHASTDVPWLLEPPRCFYCPIGGAPAGWVIRDNVLEELLPSP
jgi:hypothetical protein